MCGIAGMIGFERDRTTELLRRVNRALAHRGPDDEGLEVFPFGNAWLGLAQRRLSILDLSHLGHQPMTTLEPNGPWLTFNGEIYNFQALREELRRTGVEFHSTGDSEVLLRALQTWGPEALPKLQGMFALAYFDPAKRELLLARDPAGMKPLYFQALASSFVFASEVRAILAADLSPVQIDRSGLAGYLAYGAVQHPHTLFSGIESIPPGTYRVLKENSTGWTWKTGATAFWKFPRPDPSTSLNVAIRALPELLDRSVRDHLISDVPVGIFLSSGLDSTIVAGLSAKHHPAIRTFTVSFTDEPDYDESELAWFSAKRFGIPHERIPITAAEAESSLPEWFAALDQPSIDGFNTFLISRAVRERGMKVALSGQGADELFGGYPSFRDVARLRRYRKILNHFPVGLRRAAARVATLGRSNTARNKLRDMVSGGGDLANLGLQRRRLLNDQQLAEFGIDALTLNLNPDFQDPGSFLDLSDIGDDATAAISRLESTCYQGNMLLRDGDANGMAHGLEIRMPFLGQNMLDTVHTWPGSVRTPAGKPPKFLLRTAFADLLNSPLLRQPKRGFVLPIRRWMQSTLRGPYEAAITTLRDSKLLRPGAIDAVVSSFRAEPESPAWSRAFALFVLGDFLNRHAPRIAH